MGTPIILFGAFDRHNFGDMLLAHVAAASVPDDDLVFAGLVSRDMREHGGQIEARHRSRPRREGGRSVRQADSMTSTGGRSCRDLARLSARLRGCAIQCRFRRDHTLGEVADQLDQVVAAHGLGAVFFRAGSAPWHDDLAIFHRVASRMRARSKSDFESLNIWDICALIANGSAYCGSSLHGRIVAMAFERPRVNLWPLCTGRTCKQAEYASTWEAAGIPGAICVREMSDAIRRALSLTYDRNAVDC